MTFLPPNYETPAEGGKYLKLKKGETRFRVLGSAVVGNEYWVEADGKRKPVRKRVGEDIPTEDLEGGDGQGVKHFWAFPVWDVSESRVKVMEITQKSVRQAIQKLVDDEDWGDPSGYDIAVHREGDGMETVYSVNPKPAKPLTDAQKKAWAEVQVSGFDLDELFSGGDPFAPAPGKPSPAAPRAGKPAGAVAPAAEVDIEDIEF